MIEAIKNSTANLYEKLCNLHNQRAQTSLDGGETFTKSQRDEKLREREVVEIEYSNDHNGFQAPREKIQRYTVSANEVA